MLESRALILAKLETTYGTDAMPTPSADSILTSKPTIELITEDKERDVVLPYWGKLASIPLETGIKISFDVEARGSGEPTTPPRLGVLLRSAGFIQTVGDDDVKYNPTLLHDPESLTIYFYNDGIRYKALGCICTSVKYAAKVNETAKFSFEFTGIFGGIASFATDASFPTNPSFETTIPPVFRNGSFTFGSFNNAAVESIEVNIANTIAKRVDANAQYGIQRYSIVGREISGSFDPEVVSLNTWNPWAIYDSATLGILNATLGDTAGNRLVLTVPNCQIDSPKIAGREGIQTYSVGFKQRATLSVGLEQFEFKFN